MTYHEFITKHIRAFGLAFALLATVAALNFGLWLMHGAGDEVNQGAAVYSSRGTMMVEKNPMLLSETSFDAPAGEQWQPLSAQVSEEVSEELSEDDAGMENIPVLE